MPKCYVSSTLRIQLGVGSGRWEEVKGSGEFRLQYNEQDPAETILNAYFYASSEIVKGLSEIVMFFHEEEVLWLAKHLPYDCSSRAGSKEKMAIHVLGVLKKHNNHRIGFNMYPIRTHGVFDPDPALLGYCNIGLVLAMTGCPPALGS